MTTPSARFLRRGAALLLGGVLALTLTACSGSDDSVPEDAAGDAETSTTTSAAAPTEEPTEDGVDDPPYAGWSSDVYGARSAWICRPDLADDPCRDLDVTRLDVSGERTVERRKPAGDPPVDCFYVYPTVSSDPGTNSDRKVGPGDTEVQTVVAQAAQYARSCRVFAPIYRQSTVAALFAGEYAAGRDLAYSDVLDAWKTYVTSLSEGRGVIIIGHSQGAMLLQRLLDEEIDPDPVLRERLVSAHLLGTAVQVPDGELVGGTFADIPGCSAPDETGCVVSWSSYTAASPPPPDAIFGRSAGEGTRALCTDVVALLGRESGSMIAPVTAPMGALGIVDEVETTYLSLPDVVDVSCAAEGDVDYLSVGLADPQDRRPVAALQAENLGPAWGLHSLDLNLVQDDLVELAARQAAAYAD